MSLIRGAFLLAIYGISCCFSLHLYQLTAGYQNASRGISPQLQPGNDKALESQKFEQKLNHFDKSDTRKWNQMYYKEDKYYKSGGPVYLWMEGTDMVVPFRIKAGYWVDHAKKHNGMLFLMDHRFHIFSQPLAESSKTENLAYLTVPQALADGAAFIQEMNELHSFPKGTKWIVLGSSYGGNLAAWMRTKYPNLVHGAVASSAPVLAKMEIPELLDNVVGTIETYNKKCKVDIALANQKLDELAKTPKGRKEIGDTFKLCEALDENKFSMSLLVDQMATFISYDIQFDLDNKKVKKMCDTMLKDADTKTPVKRYSKLMDSYMKTYGWKCLKSNFDSHIDFLRRTDLFSSIISERTWLYQMCTEFGWFPITGKKSSTFSKYINSEYYLQLCAKAFKPAFDKKFISQAVEKTNKAYGGLKLNTQRTLFVHGSSDPWRSLGITLTKNNKNVDVVIIKGGSHTTDSAYQHLRSKNKNRQEAIKKIMSTLDSWLKK